MKIELDPSAASPRRRRSAKRSDEPAPTVRSVMYQTSPLLASPTPPWRSKFLVALVGIGFLVLVGRAAYIQIIGTDFYQKQGASRYARTLELPANRGRISDRNGLILASSVPAPSLWAIPKDFEASPAERRELAKLLNMTSAELQTRLEGSQNFVWLKRQADEQRAKQILAMNLKGIHQVREYKRVYPEGEAVAQVVGFTNIEDKGQEGIELQFQDQLAGRDGTRRVIKDRLGRVIEDIGDSVAPVDGRDLALSIDSKIQFFAYQRVRDAVQQHKAKAGSAVVLDVKTGEVLALANYPSYIPGDRANLTGGQMRNRALTDVFEPGSTMKPFIVSLGMETGRITPNTMIDTGNGRLTIQGRTIRDDHQLGVISVQQVIQKSSNIGAVKIALTMQPREMWDMFTAVGFGQRPQITFPGAVTGRLRPYRTWKPIEQATMAYGYGLSTSLFQLAHAYTMFANDGEIRPITILKTNVPTGPGVRVLSPATARSIREMLHMVTMPGGTAPKAAALGYSVGGKTGTAHKQEGRGYSSNKYRSWFVGMAPITQPRIVVAVMVDEPSDGRYFGGDVAAPVFSEIVEQTLRSMNVQPDMDVKQQIITRALPAEAESF